MSDDNTSSRRGRPRLPPGAKRSARIELRLRAADKERIEKAAWEAGQTVSTFILEAAMRRADEVLD